MMNRQDLDAKVSSVTSDYIGKRDKIALTIGVVQHGEPYITGLGQVSDESCVLPHAQTLYEIGSITKVLTGTVLAQLLQEETVALDDRISLYLPEAIGNQLPTSVQAITLRQLATHTAGLPRLPDNFLSHVKDSTNPYLGYTATELYAALVDVKLLNEPSQRCEYSNFGMGLLGHLLSLKTAQPYEELVKDRVCQPFGMTDTTIHLTPEQQQRLTPGHHAADGTLSANWDFDVLAPAGAFRSTVQDLLMFLQAQMDESDARKAAVFARSQERYFQVDEYLSIGLAWHILTFPNGKVVHWHNGGTGGYKSFIGFDKARASGIVVLSNYGDAFANDSSVDEIAMRLLTD